MRALLATCTVALVVTVASFAAEFELAYIGPVDGTALQGVRLRVEESNRQGKFFGVQLTLATAGDGEVTVRGVALFADTPGAVETAWPSAGPPVLRNLTQMVGYAPQGAGAVPSVPAPHPAGHWPGPVRH